MLRVCSFICCAALATGVGCGLQSSTPQANSVSTSEVALDDLEVDGRVAVIDLDVVATRLGRDVEILNSIKSRQSTLAEQLQAIKTDYENQIVEKQQEIGGSPTTEESQALVGMRNDALQKLAAVQTQARDNLSQHSSQVISQFREQVKAVARQVASERGLDVVLTRNDSVVFSYEPNVDITEDVIANMVSSGGHVDSGAAAEYTPAATTDVPQVASPPSANEYR